MFNLIHAAVVEQDLAVEIDRLRHWEDDILVRVRETVRRLDERVRNVVDDSGAESIFLPEPARAAESETLSEDW